MIVLNVIAWCVIAWRAATRRLTRAELCVILIYLAHFVLEFGQLVIADGRTIHDADERYLRPADVLLLCWIAWGAVQLIRRAAWTRFVFASCIVLLFCYSVVMTFKHHANGRRARVVALTDRAAAAIRADWHGADDAARVFNVREYHSRARPVVNCRYHRVAWLAGGRVDNHEVFGAVDAPDYWVVQDFGTNAPPARAALMDTFVVGTGPRQERWNLYRADPALRREGGNKQ